MIKAYSARTVTSPFRWGPGPGRVAPPPAPASLQVVLRLRLASGCRSHVPVTESLSGGIMMPVSAAALAGGAESVDSRNLSLSLDSETLN
eukprot:3746726-Rhodomonas_salina.1